MAPTPTKSNWLFSLAWINVAVAIVILIQLTGNQISSARELFHVLAFSLVYANLTSVLAMFAIGWLAARAEVLKLPLALFLFLSILVFSTVGCLLAQLLLMAIGFVVPQHWLDYLRTLRVALPLAAVFGLGALVQMREARSFCDRGMRPGPNLLERCVLPLSDS